MVSDTYGSQIPVEQSFEFLGDLIQEDVPVSKDHGIVPTHQGQLIAPALNFIFESLLKIRSIETNLDQINTQIDTVGSEIGFLNDQVLQINNKVDNIHSKLDGVVNELNYKFNKILYSSLNSAYFKMTTAELCQEEEEKHRRLKSAEEDLIQASNLLEGWELIHVFYLAGICCHLRNDTRLKKFYYEQALEILERMRAEIVIENKQKMQPNSPLFNGLLLGGLFGTVIANFSKTSLTTGLGIVVGIGIFILVVRSTSAKQEEYALIKQEQESGVGQKVVKHSQFTINELQDKLAIGLMSR